MSTLMKEEILSTAARLADTYQACLGPAQEIAALVREKGIKHFFLACRGSSENAGLYFKYLCETRSHKCVTILKPSVITVYRSTVDMSDGMLIAISQGGRGVDLRMVVEEARRQGVPTVAVTNIPENPIGASCDYILPLSVGLEQSMAATKSFSAELCALYLLACAIAGDEPSERVPQAFAAGLACEDRVKKLLGPIDTDRPVYVMGRGKSLALARELCCKLQETCLVSAFPFSAADFMHGPFALIEPGSRTVVFHSKYACYESTRTLIESMTEQDAKVLAITDNADDLECGAVVVDTHSEDESIFAMTAVLQLLAADLSERRGTNPDTSRNLNKYTETV